MVKTNEVIYIFEFNLKEDTERLKVENKRIVLIGAGFDPEEKTVGEWLIETI